jgi:RNA-binding protein 39
MAKLNRDHAIQTPPMPTYLQQPTLTISRYLLLKNMFNPDEEEGADWDQDIKSDILEECSKYGSIQHIFVEKYSQVSLPIISQEERGFIISIYTLPPMYVSSFH